MMWKRSDLAAGRIGESEDLTRPTYVVYMQYVLCEGEDFLATHSVRVRKHERNSSSRVKLGTIMCTEKTAIVNVIVLPAAVHDA
jgi:hypothetical protein